MPNKVYRRYKNQTWPYPRVGNDTLAKRVASSKHKADMLCQALMHRDAILAALNPQCRDRILWRLQRAGVEPEVLRDPNARSVHLSSRDCRAWDRAAMRVYSHRKKARKVE